MEYRKHNVENGQEIELIIRERINRLSDIAEDFILGYSQEFIFQKSENFTGNF